MKKSNNNNSVLLITLTAITLVLSVSTQAKIYKWVDANGQVHYTAQPPIQKKDSKITVTNIEKKIRNQSGKYSDQSSSDKISPNSENNENSDKEIKLAGPDERLKSYCATQRKNLKQLQDNFHNIWTDVNGKQTMLDQKQRLEKVSLIDSQIKENCTEVKK